MTEEEKERVRAEWRRRDEGYRLIEADRRERIRNTVTKDVLGRFDFGFHVSRQRPLSEHSGLEEFYRILQRSRP